MNVEVLNLFKLVFPFSSDVYLEVDLLDRMVILFQFLRNFHIVLHHGCTSFIPSNIVQEFPFPTSSSTSCKNSLFFTSTSTLCKNFLVFTSSSTLYKNSPFSTSSSAFIICGLSDDRRSDRCEVTFHCGFDLHFSDERCEASFHVPVGLYILFGIMSTQACFLIKIFVYFWYWVIWAVCEFWLLILYQSCQFLLFRRLFFTWLVVSFLKWSFYV